MLVVSPYCLNREKTGFAVNVSMTKLRTKHIVIRIKEGILFVEWEYAVGSFVYRRQQEDNLIWVNNAVVPLTTSSVYR